MLGTSSVLFGTSVKVRERVVVHIAPVLTPPGNESVPLILRPRSLAGSLVVCPVGLCSGRH